MSYELRLTRRRAWSIFNQLRSELAGDFSTRIDKKVPVCGGKYDHDEHVAKLGVKEIYDSGLNSFLRVSDEDFTTAVVALYHEYGHHLDWTGRDTPKEIILSAISAFYNPGYRENGWREFPHEISAERMGVLLAYDSMGRLFGQFGRDCVVGHVLDRAKNTSYVLQNSDVLAVFTIHDKDALRNVSDYTYDDLSKMFDTAMIRSLEHKREPQSGLRRYERDRMSAFFKRPENVSYFRKFIDEIPGALKDRMAASVNIHIDPALMDPRLDASDVDMDRVFNVQQRSMLMQKCFDAVATANRDSCTVDRQGPDF